MDTTTRTLRFLFGAALGGYFGAEFALVFSSALWAVAAGIVLGASLAGSIFSWPDIKRWAPLAWRRTILWRPNWAYLWQFGLALAFWLSFMSIFWWVGLLLPRIPPGVSIWTTLAFFNGTLFLLALLFSLTTVGDKSMFGDTTKVKQGILLLNFFSFWAIAGYIVVCFIIYAVSRSPVVLVAGLRGTVRVVKALVSFSKHLLLLVYSDDLLLCVFSGAAGVLVGVAMGHAVYGGAGGLASGIVIKIVMKDMLELAPQTSKNK